MATVNEKLQLQGVRTWFDPMDMFRQIAPNGVVKKEAVDKSLSPGDALDSDAKAEIDQTLRPVEETASTLPDRTAASGSDAQKLMTGIGCPFAGQDGKKGIAGHPPAEVSGATNLSSKSPSGDSEWNKIEHPNAPLSSATIEILGAGEQEGIGSDPHIDLPSRSV